MAKTVVEKLTSPSPDVAVFKISGVLGYHENKVLVKFFDECAKKNITKLVMDFSDLGSLGGGCARIIREAAMSGRIVVCIVGASNTVQNFLGDTASTQIHYEADQTMALAQVDKVDPSPVPKADNLPPEAPAKPAAQVSDAKSRGTAKVAKEKPLPRTKREPVETADVAVAVKEDERPKEKVLPADKPAEAKNPAVDSPSEDELERRLVQYRALFSLNSAFSQIQEKSDVLEAFLLTAIAQVGAESASFFERNDKGYGMVAWKGFETAAPDNFALAAGDVDSEQWISSPAVYETGDAPFSEVAKKNLSDWGMPIVAPFIIHRELEGLVFLGSPARDDVGDASRDYLVLLIHQAAIAYQNSRRYEEESQRTLGLVQSLTSMIEEHTLSRGNTETILDYVHAVAKAMRYPKEHINELIYGTVLRDVGMVKVSDLIVKSDRELDEAEWDIIKRHPIEGAEMLNSMSFSEHASNVVLYHHERFSGRGYPHGIQGAQIPLGARILSVVESYAVMLQDRPTRPAVAPEQALNTLRENWGVRYDPDVIEVFVEIVEQEIRSGKKIKYDSGRFFTHKDS